MFLISHVTNLPGAGTSALYMHRFRDVPRAICVSRSPDTVVATCLIASERIVFKNKLSSFNARKHDGGYPAPNSANVIDHRASSVLVPLPLSMDHPMAFVGPKTSMLHSATPLKAAAGCATGVGRTRSLRDDQAS